MRIVLQKYSIDKINFRVFVCCPAHQGISGEFHLLQGSSVHVYAEPSTLDIYFVYISKTFDMEISYLKLQA